MNDYKATGLAEGWIDTSDEDENNRSLAIFTRYWSCV